MSEPTKGKPIPRKPRAKKEKLPLISDECHEELHTGSINVMGRLGNPLETRDDDFGPFVPNEYGAIPPQTGETGLTIKGAPLVFIPREAETMQDAISKAVSPAKPNDENNEQTGHQTQTDGTSSTQSSQPDSNKNRGDVALTVAETGSAYTVKQLESAPPARARDGETRGQCWERLRREGRAAGMTRRGAISYAGGVIDRLFPPPVPIPEPILEEVPLVEPEPIPAEMEREDPDWLAEQLQSAPTPIPSDQGVVGLGTLPADWPKLPANASLQVEIAWVSANRLLVRDGSSVDLSRALSPAPSYSALSWLETSILFPSKFADISVKATANQDDEREGIRREKLAIEEIRGLLAEMLEG